MTDTTSTFTSTSPETATDVALSLTGFDEVAITKFFGVEYTELEDRPMMFLRTLMFIVERRGGTKDSEAYKAAMNATTREVSDYFPDDPTETASADLTDDERDEADELGKDE